MIITFNIGQMFMIIAFNIGQMLMIITFEALDFESLSSSLRNSLLGYGIVIPPNALESQKSSGYIAYMHDNL